MMLQIRHKYFRHTGRFILVLFTLFSLYLTVIIALDWMQRAGTWFWEETACTIETSQVSERPAIQANRYQFMTGSSSGYKSKAKAVDDIPTRTVVTYFFSTLMTPSM